jgi:hypothetical protein
VDTLLVHVPVPHQGFEFRKVHVLPRELNEGLEPPAADEFSVVFGGGYQLTTVRVKGMCTLAPEAQACSLVSNLFG